VGTIGSLRVRGRGRDGEVDALTPRPHSQDVHAAVMELQARTADVESSARRRAAAAKQYKQASTNNVAAGRALTRVSQEAQRLQLELNSARAELETQRESAALATSRAAAAEAALADARCAGGGAADAEARAAAAEREAAFSAAELAEAQAVRERLERILLRLAHDSPQCMGE